jgi:hypothetical protein
VQIQQRSRRRYGVARAVVTFLGLYQGAVPLVVRPLFGAEQRFAPALWLPAPWWWLACLGVVVVTIGLLAAISAAQARAGSPAAAPGEAAPARDGTAGYDALSAFVLLAGIYNGIAPFVVRLFSDGSLLLAFPLRLPAPWWWITSLAVVVVTVALLGLLDRAKERRRGCG